MKQYWTEETPFGTIHCLTENGQLTVATYDPNDDRLVELPEATEMPPFSFTELYESYLREEETSIELSPAGTPFQKRVWSALRCIPGGVRLAYSELAEQMGLPSATRAVASAVAANPVALLIPCHRVVPKGGGVGQFGWGSERKQAILDYEMEHASAQVVHP